MTTIVRYQAKPDRADENQLLIEAVFTELEQRQLAGFFYRVFRLAHGVSFIHVFVEDDEVAEPAHLTDVAAFQAFTAHIDERTDSSPITMSATMIGKYR